MEIERADGEVTLLSYDAVGNAETVTPPEKPTHDFEYTDVNLVDTYMPPSTTVLTDHNYNGDREPDFTTLADGRTIDYVFDTSVPPKGQLEHVVMGASSLDYSYYPTNPGSGYLQTATRTDAQGAHTLTYTYNGGWLRTEAMSGAGNGSGTVEWVPDLDLRVDQIKANGTLLADYGYDDDGLLTSAATPTSSMIVGRRADNGIIDATTLGSVTTTQTVTGFGELDLMSASTSAGIVYEEDVIRRDELGRITQRGEAVTNGAGMDTASYAYTCDHAGRLTDVVVNASESRTYGYDANGNRTGFISSLGTVVGRYDDEDRLSSYCPEVSGVPTPIAGLPCFGYEHNASGQLLYKTDLATNDLTVYDYDELGNLMSVGLPGGLGTFIEYEIDPRGRRVGKKVDGAVEKRWLYGSQLEPIAELDPSNNQVVATFVYATKPHVPDFIVRGGVTYRIVSDHLGSVRLVVNTSNGAVAQRIDYDEWGNATLVTGTWDVQPFGFAGGIYDADTGLTRFGARDYDPVVGRWTTKDPILFGGGDTNLLVYVHGDPINWIDPTGLEEEIPWCGPGGPGIYGDQCVYMSCMQEDGTQTWPSTYGAYRARQVGEDLMTLAGDPVAAAVYVLESLAGEATVQHWITDQVTLPASEWGDALERNREAHESNIPVAQRPPISGSPPRRAR